MRNNVEAVFKTCMAKLAVQRASPDVLGVCTEYIASPHPKTPQPLSITPSSLRVADLALLLDTIGVTLAVAWKKS